MEAVVLEVYDRRGHVRFRQKLTALPANIGRALACDVIIDDPLVSATHARLEEDAAGVLTLVDTSSRNGLMLGNKKVERVTFPAHQPVQLGGTRIGVVRASAPASPTGIHRISRLDQPWLLAPALALVAFGAYFDGWLDARELKPLKLIGNDVLPVLFVLGGWAMIWAVANRIAQGRFGFIGHLTVTAFTAGAIVWFEKGVVPLIRFVFHTSWLTSMFIGDLTILLAALMLGTQLVRVTGWPRRRCLLIAFSLGLGFLAVTSFNRLIKEDDFDPNLYPSSAALPPAFVVGPVATVDEFLAGTDGLQKQVDEMRVAP